MATNEQAKANLHRKFAEANRRHAYKIVWNVLHKGHPSILVKCEAEHMDGVSEVVFEQSAALLAVTPLW